MGTFKHWLLTSSIDNALFFTNIRKTARKFHKMFGHKWVYNTACYLGLGEIKPINFRRCVDCDAKEILDESGENKKWVERS